MLSRVWVEASDAGVTRIRLGSDLAREEPTGPRATDLVRQAREQIEEYVTGRRERFDVPVDLSGVTAFGRSVYHALTRIPFGETASYGEVAARVNCASARAIGQAVGRNPVPILVPCHRIVTRDGRLGGFSCGLDYKVALLGLEGIASGGASFRSRLSGRA